LNIEYLQTLSNNEIRDIHQATLEVLERTGIRIYESAALKILKDAGAYIDEKNKLEKKHQKNSSFLLEIQKTMWR
jgi:trimethylamine:corrinoid methyltransferase-like protein